jgi:hypothetical protein
MGEKTFDRSQRDVRREKRQFRDVESARRVATCWSSACTLSPTTPETAIVKTRWSVNRLYASCILAVQEIAIFTKTSETDENWDMSEFCLAPV